MTLFLTVAVALTLMVLVWLLWPLWRGTRAGTATLADLNSKVYRDQLRELERDLARGQLTAGAYDEARDELKRRLLQDVDASASQPATAASRGRGRWTAIAIAVLVPMASAGVYSRVGNAAAIDAADQARAATPENIERVVEHLAEALQKAPDNPQGWVMLARAYTKMSRYGDAAAAYERAAPLIEKTPDLLVEQADVLIAASGDNLEGRPMELVGKALALQPRHPMALMLTGMADYRRGDFDAAIGHWQTLLEVLPAGSEEHRAVEANIAQARAEGGAAAASPSVASGAATPPVAVASPGVSGEVSISPEMAAQVKPDDIVFVVARGDDGSRAPLAVLRKRVADLPLKFTLDDSMAMIPDRTISKAQRVIVVARVSRSGQPVSQPGDLTSEPSPAIQNGTSGLRLVISRQL